MIKLLSTNLLPLRLHPLLPIILTPNPLDRQSPTLHIHWETAISISKPPQAPKKTEKKFIDAPNIDDPDAADDDAADAPNANDNYAVPIDSKNPNICW